MDLEKMGDKDLVDEYYSDICSLKRSEWGDDLPHPSYQEEVEKTEKEILSRLAERDSLKAERDELIKEKRSLARRVKTSEGHHDLPLHDSARCYICQINDSNRGQNDAE